MTVKEFKDTIAGMSGEILILSSRYTYPIAVRVIQLTVEGTHVSFGYSILEISTITAVFQKSDSLSIYKSVKFGSDPELFFIKDGNVVPSTAYLTSKTGLVAEDGFQLELHPQPDSCRQTSGGRIARALNDALKIAEDHGATLSLAVGHVIDDDTWGKTPMMLRRFGCNPTDSAYDDKTRRVTGIREKFRAAGGHIHIGSTFLVNSKDNVKNFISVADAVCGSLFVLLDRDDNNIRRRKNYGRAGEHRLKSYGVEYRVLSNFWLHSYTLWSLATAQLRIAISIVDKGLTEELFEYINISDVRKAINENDTDLAMKNFEGYAKFVRDKNLITTGGIGISNIDKTVEWLSNDPASSFNLTLEGALASWQKRIDASGTGYETFIKDYSPTNKRVT